MPYASPIFNIYSYPSSVSVTGRAASCPKLFFVRVIQRMSGAEQPVIWAARSQILPGRAASSKLFFGM